MKQATQSWDSENAFVNDGSWGNLEQVNKNPCVNVEKKLTLWALAH